MDWNVYELQPQDSHLFVLFSDTYYIKHIEPTRQKQNENRSNEEMYICTCAYAIVNGLAVQHELPLFYGNENQNYFEFGSARCTSEKWNGHFLKWCRWNHLITFSVTSECFVNSNQKIIRVIRELRRPMTHINFVHCKIAFCFSLSRVGRVYNPIIIRSIIQIFDVFVRKLHSICWCSEVAIFQLMPQRTHSHLDCTFLSSWLPFDRLKT